MGFGMFGEQGTESIHADFNNLKRRFSVIPDPVERLRCIMREHHLRCTPHNNVATPVKTQKTRAEE